MTTTELAMTSRLPVVTRGPLLVGLITWFAALLVMPAPMAARILLLAPLVIVPRLIALLPPRPWIGAMGGWPSFLAALPLVVAFSLTPGALAAVFVLPWLAVASVGVVAGVRHGL